MGSGAHIAIIVVLLFVAIFFVLVVLPSPPPISGGGHLPPDPSLPGFIKQVQAASTTLVGSTNALNTSLNGVEGAVATTFTSYDSGEGVSDAAALTFRKGLDPLVASTVKDMKSYVAEVAAFDKLVQGGTAETEPTTMMSHKPDAYSIMYDVTTTMADMLGLSSSITSFISTWDAAYEIVSGAGCHHSSDCHGGQTCSGGHCLATKNGTMQGAINELTSTAATFKAQGALNHSAWQTDANQLNAAYMALFNHLAGI